jgi:predicted Abi (CAAX) family protease
LRTPLAILALFAVATLSPLCNMCYCWATGTNTVFRTPKWNRNGPTPRQCATFLIHGIFFPALVEELAWRIALAPSPEQWAKDPCALTAVVFAMEKFVLFHVWPQDGAPFVAPKTVF